MSKKIAVYLNHSGQTAELNEPGIIKVFSKEQEQWNVVKELPFTIDGVRGMGAVRSELVKITEALGECKVFVAKEITGLTYTVFDTMGFNTWEMDGEPKEFLEYVLQKEEEEEEAVKAMTSSNSCEKEEIVTPVETEEKGHYTINLKKIQERNTGVSSKQALQPFLNNTIFYELKVTCSHIPGWLEPELESLNYNFQIAKSSPTELIITISKKTCSV